MTMTRFLLLPLLLTGILFAQEAKKELPALTAAEFDARRARLMKAFDDGVVVVDSGVLRAGAAGIDANTPIFDFSYLTGFHDEQGVLVLIPSQKETFLFISGDCKA